MQFDEGGEGGVDLIFGDGLQDRDLHPLGAGRFLHVSDHGLGIRIVRVHKQRDRADRHSRANLQSAARFALVVDRPR
jgi:hypothetical protein